MENSTTKRTKLSERINAYVNAETPFRTKAGNWSKRARMAMDEANSLSLERVDIALRRLPKKLDGFKIIQLSDIHHSPFTGLDHIERAVKIANRLRPDVFLLTGDYVSHDRQYIAPAEPALAVGRMARVLDREHRLLPVEDFFEPLESRRRQDVAAGGATHDSQVVQADP